MRLGLPENAAFFLITNAALFGFLLCSGCTCATSASRSRCASPACWSTGFTQGAVRWFEYQYWMSDPAALALVMLAFFLIERGKWGALRRERRCRVRARDLRPRLPLRLPARAAARTAARSGARPRPRRSPSLPLAILVAIRRLVTPKHPDDFVAGIVDSMGFRIAHVLDNQLYVVTIGAFGVLVPLLLLFPKHLPGLARRHFDRALYVAVGLRDARDLEQQRAAARLRAAGPRPGGALVPAPLPRRDAAAARAGLRRGRPAAGPVLDRAALRRDRDEHLPARQLDDGRGHGRRGSRPRPRSRRRARR